MVEKGYLKIPEGKVFFRKLGAGKHLIIALHGFGQDSAVYSHFPLPQGYCLYALDLPWHGLTEWWGDSFSPESLKIIVDEILLLEAACTHLDLIGFSYGAALWLGALPIFSTHSHRVFLVSPEAIGGRWQCCTTNIPGKARRWIAVIMLNHYSLLLKLAALLTKINLLHPFALRFLRYNLEDHAKRLRIINTWTNLSLFPIRKHKLTMRSAALPAIHLLIGEKDPLLDVNKVKKWADQVAGLKLQILPYGHHLLEKADWAMLLRQTL